MCECDICRRNARIEATLELGNIEDLRNLVKELSEELVCTELDRDVFEAKLLGKWPSMDQ